MPPLLTKVEEMKAARLFPPPGAVDGAQGSESRRYNK